MRKRPTVVAAIAALLTVAVLASGCGEQASGAAGGGEQTELRYQGSVGTVTPAELAADLGYLDGLTLKWIGNTTSGPQDIQAVTTGDIDFGGAFNGAIVKLVARGAPITAVIGYYGVDKDSYSGFYVPDGSPITSANDLIGKKVGMNVLGAHHEAVLDEYLIRKGVSEGDIKKVEPIVVAPVNTEQSLRQKQIDVGVLGGILRDKALARGGVHPLFTDFELFGDFTAGSYVLTNRFIKQNPKTSRKFIEGVAKALEWARTQPRDVVVARFTAIIDKRGRAEDTKTIKLWKSYGVAGKGGVINKKEFSTWIDWLDRQGQLKKKIKPREVYTIDLHPYKSDAR